MLMPRRPPGHATQGVTLIELLVTLTILALLMAAAAPSMSQWSANSRLRAVAEEIQNGVRQAQTEAVKSNRQAVFALTNATPSLTATPAANGNAWFARLLPNSTMGNSADDSYYLRGSSAPKQQGVTITGPAVICFNSIGRPVANTSTGLGANCAAPASATSPTTYDLTSTQANLRLRVQVQLGGQVRMCDRDKTLSTSVPDGC